MSDPGPTATSDPIDPSTVGGSNTYLNGLIGGVVGLVLFFVPFSTVIGGAVAGYLEGTDTEAGAKAGLIAGLVMFVPTVLLGGLFVGGFGVIVPPYVEPWMLIGGGILLALLYMVGLSVLGGMAGSYLKGDALASGPSPGGESTVGDATGTAEPPTGAETHVGPTSAASDSPTEDDVVAASESASPGRAGSSVGDSDRLTVSEDQASNTLLNGVIGGVAVILLSFIPFSPILGGGIAGYLEGGTYHDGAKVGLIAGLVVFVPILALVLPFALLGGFFGGPAMFVPLFFGLAVLFFIAAYFVGLTVLGGVMGIYVKEEME